MPRITCTTSFDITKTGVTGFFSRDKIPFIDESGSTISDQSTWTVARNRHRNWETVIQILSLRTQIFDVQSPTVSGNYWYFEFSVDSASVYSDTNSDDLNILKSDANNVPMLVMTDNDTKAAMTRVYDNPNLMFEIKNSQKT
jgi:hypothetical protein